MPTTIKGVSVIGAILAFGAVLTGCDSRPPSAVAANSVNCQARPSDERILSTLKTAFKKQVSIVGVVMACNSATVMFDQGGSWDQVSLLGFDNGLWILVKGNALTSINYYKIL
jgi:hypothetical protein